LAQWLCAADAVHFSVGGNPNVLNSFGFLSEKKAIVAKNARKSLAFLHPVLNRQIELKSMGLPF